MGFRVPISSFATTLATAASVMSLGACIVGGKLAEETKASDGGSVGASPRSSTLPGATPAAPPIGVVGATGSDDEGDVDASVAIHTTAATDAGTIAVPVSCAPSGTLVTLATSKSVAYQIAVDATSVYWVDPGTNGGSGDGALMKVTHDGSGLTTLVPNLNWGGGIAVDATSVYWTSSGGLYKVPLGGGTPVLLSPDFTNDNITVGPAGVYGTNGDDAPVSTLLGGGTTTVLGQGTGQNTYGVAVDAKNLYWTNFDDPGLVAQVSLAGGPTTSLATGHVAEGIAVDASSVYWVDAGGIGPGALMKVPIGGGTPKTLASGLNGPTSLAIDATYAYITTGATSNSLGAIVRVPLTGGAVTVLACAQNQPWSIAVDATGVYWSAIEDDPGDEDDANVPRLGGVIRRLTPE
jgi:hypothetical protein